MRQQVSSLIVPVALLALPFLLILAPTSVLADGPELCLLRNLGIPCWGCGMTRAISSVVHFRFLAAFEYNPLVVVVFPLLSFIWFRAMGREVVKFRPAFPPSAAGGKP